MQRRVGDLKVGDRFKWYHWETVHDLTPTDATRLGDGKGNGLYVSTGRGMPIRICVDQMVEVAS